MSRIITNLAVFDVGPDGLVLRALAPGVTEELVAAVTEPAFATRALNQARTVSGVGRVLASTRTAGAVSRQAS